MVPSLSIKSDLADADKYEILEKTNGKVVLQFRSYNMAGKAARAAVESSESERDTMELMGSAT
jgi:hypothetical protein